MFRDHTLRSSKTRLLDLSLGLTRKRGRARGSRSAWPWEVGGLKSAVMGSSPLRHRSVLQTRAFFFFFFFARELVVKQLLAHRWVRGGPSFSSSVLQDWVLHFRNGTGKFSQDSLCIHFSVNWKQ